MRFLSILVLAFTLTSASQCASANGQASDPPKDQKSLAGLDKAYFASGCFWCVEAVYESVEGVEEAISGYAGGHTLNPTYQSIGSGTTGHAETVEVYYDSHAVSYQTLLKVFFGSHDPTTLNRQGPDAGTQYRSAIFYTNEMEKATIEAYIQELTESKAFEGPITTEVSELKKFYPAEDYHQDYERRNPNQPYVRAVSIPRLKKFQRSYPDLLKKNDHP